MMVGVPPPRCGADLVARRQRGDRDVEIRGAPEQMIAGGRQGPIYTGLRARRQRVMTAARPDVARARRLPYTCPLMPFTGLGLDPALLRATRELGFTRPTPVQQDAIPPALAGRDVLACAMTGSGKTAAFLLPIMQRLLAKRRGVTRALVLAPTRELAAQIDAHFVELAVHTPLTGAAVFGGVGMGPQEHAFRSGVDVIVATPGRLLDHFRQPYAKLEHLEVLVLDEADRMLDMGFLPDIRRVLRHLPARRQTLFFSATIPPPIIRPAREMLRNPVTVNLERKAAPAVRIPPAAYPLPPGLKSPLPPPLLERNAMPPPPNPTPPPARLTTPPPTRPADPLTLH